MPLIDRLERKIGWIAIPGVVRILAGFQLLTFVLLSFNPGFIEALTFEPALIFKGQVWRLFFFIFLPPLGYSLLLIVALWFMWFLGDILEAQWGSFRLTLFLLGGVVGTVIGGFLVYFASPGEIIPFNNLAILNVLAGSWLLIAVGILFPHIEIRLMFVIPIRIMWLALFRGGIFVIFFLSALAQDLWLGIGFLCVFANVLIAFGPKAVRDYRQRGQVASRRRRFEAAQAPDHEFLHRCKVCDKTEHDDPDLDFRVAADGEEYCMEHLPGKAQEPK